VKDVQFTRAKSFDTFCPIGPWIDTDIDPTNVAIETRVNTATMAIITTISPLSIKSSFLSRQYACLL
jgi:2-keto-4-pentenoate hydratase/2-oxohepta-3-ene-1,7-dioic acid hydratase in catechol pathway